MEYVELTNKHKFLFFKSRLNNINPNNLRISSL